MLDIRALYKSFGANEVLKGLDLKVAAGRTVAVIGASGSGKSTLVRCINHLEPIDSGSILVGDRTHILPDRLEENGRKLTARDVARFRTRIGMVFQSFNLFPHLTVLGNIIEAPTGVLGWPRARAVDQAMALLTRVGLADKADAYPATLSGGQQQRVAIVRALIMDPPLMLFDEPTSALDPRLTEEVLTVIRDMAIRNRTAIIVTHEMGFARNVATDVVVMADGRIAEQGPPDAIFGAPRTVAAREFLRLAG
jgi:ABC-type polar amino acid transport system ATPase subunit